ncbi:MAG: ComF family protein [Ruminococcaceae bacterium]|nr:ComF family protein [Oscillospiraceae bacterium]
MMKVFKVIANSLFPNKCISCGEIVENDDFLCDYCYELLERIDLLKICKRCGRNKKDCECKYRVFHFNGCVAPFENKDIARKSMYKFKFSKNMRTADFFGFEMAKAVETIYKEIDFDYITFVPMHFLKRLKRGFNQSQILANKLSRILGIPLRDDLLNVKFSFCSQHDLDYKQRYENAKKLYKYKRKIAGKTVLLVDDIKTTGASLDACAKQMILAGAQNVYCVTGLITKRKER